MASAEKVVEERKAEIDAQAARREQIARTVPGQLSIRQADRATAEANLEAAEAQLNCAQLNLSFCHIVFPVHGIVTQRSAEIGNRMNEARPLMMIVAERYVGYCEFQRDPAGENACRATSPGACRRAEQGLRRHA